MRVSKRSKRSSYTPTSAKKRKVEAPAPPIRVYYSSAFDLLNFSDTQYLQQIISHFPYCQLIVGIEDPPNTILTLQEREFSISKTGLAREILCPALTLSKSLLHSYRIQYICTPSPNSFTNTGLEDYVKVLERSKALTSHDLISRVLLKKSLFVAKCLESGFSRQQLGVTLLEELRIKLKKIFNFKRWKVFGRPNLRLMKGYKSFFYRQGQEESVKEKDSL